MNAARPQPVIPPHRRGAVAARCALCIACLLVSSIALAAPVAPRCNATGKDNSVGYERALSAVWNLPEYVTMEHHGVNVAAIEAVDHEVLIHGQCYWEITTYTDSPQSMQRMDTFYVNAADKVVMADDLGGQRISIAAWRRLQTQLAMPAESAKP